MQIAVVPTVFVALGGTGKFVLQRLRERLTQRVGTPDLPFFRYLYVDTDEGSLKTATSGLSDRAVPWSRTNRIEPSPDTIAKVQRPEEDRGDVVRTLGVESWMDAQARRQLNKVEFARGVEGRRMYSHLGFLASRNLDPLCQNLVGFYNSLVQTGRLAGKALDEIEPRYLNVVPAHVEGGVRFVVLTSSGGGTGSGTFIDFGYLLRHMTQKYGWQGVRQLGLVAMARTDVDNVAQKRNTAALLTELDHYSDRTRPALYEATYLQAPNDPVRQQVAPYEAVYLASGVQGHVPIAEPPSEAFELLLWKMAEFLLVDAVAVFDDKAPATSVLMPRGGARGATAFQGDIGQNPPGLQAFGISCREWPAAMMHRRLYGRAVETLSETWRKPQPEPVRQVVEPLRRALGIPSDTEQQVGAVRSREADVLFEALQQPVNDLDPRSQLQKVYDRALSDKSRPPADVLAAARNDLIRMFKPVEHPPHSADQEGILPALIRANLDRLKDRKDSKSPVARLTRDLLALTTQGEAGPASAAEAARLLQEAVRRERTYVHQCLTEVEPCPSNPDSLMPCWQFANDSLNHLILTSKAALYSEVDDWLGKLGTRLRHFTAYMNEWSDRMPRGEAAFPEEGPSLVVPPALRQRLESIPIQPGDGLHCLERNREHADGTSDPGLMARFQQLVEDGLPPRDAAGNPTLFAEGPPTTSQGRTDFSYLEDLEREIFRSVEQGEANPYRVEIMTVLQQEAARKREDYPRLVEDARFLINFNTGATEYGRLPFLGSPTHFTRIANPNQAGNQAFENAEISSRGWLEGWPGNVRELSSYDHVTRSLNTYTAGYVCERCTVRTELIFGYSYPERRALLGLDQFPAVTDKRIKLPLDPEALQRARMLLLGSMLLPEKPPIWVYQGEAQGVHRFTYYEEDGQGYQTHRRNWDASHDLETAVRALADEGEVMQALERRVHEHLAKHDAGLVTSALIGARNHINDERQRAGDEPVGSILRWNLRNVGFDASLNALLEFAREYQVPLPAQDHPYAVERTLDDGGSSPVSVAGWYCTNCNQFFGVNMPSWKGSCSNCGNPHPRRSR